MASRKQTQKRPTSKLHERHAANVARQKARLAAGPPPPSQPSALGVTVVRGAQVQTGPTMTETRTPGPEPKPRASEPRRAPSLASEAAADTTRPTEPDQSGKK